MTKQIPANFSHLMKTLRLRAGCKNNLRQMRKDCDAFGALFPIAAGVVGHLFELCGRPVEVLIPQDAQSGCVLLYLHGGGYVMGSIRSHRHLASRIAAAANIRTLVVDYRLAPENPYPAAIEDADAIYGSLLVKGIEPHCIAVVGDSAGGGLCVSLLVRLKQKGMPLPGACVCLSPWVDLTLKGNSWVTHADFDDLVNKKEAHWMACAYLKDEDPRHPIASPVYADLSGLPAMLIHAGSKEVLVDDAVALHRRATQCSVRSHLEIWDNMPHVWHFMASLLKEGQRAIDRVAQFLCSHLH